MKLGTQGWVSSWTSPRNPRPCHVGWPQSNPAQGKHKVSTWKKFGHFSPMSSSVMTGKSQIKSCTQIFQEKYLNYLF